MDKRLGAQYFTVRDYTQTVEDFDQTCNKISQMGYQLVQLSASPLEAAPMKEVLDKYHLEVITTHRDFHDFVSNLDEIIEYNKILGSNLCSVAMMPKEYVENNETMTEFIQKVNKIGQRLKKENMQFGYHNHAIEFAKLDGKLIYDRLVEETDPEQVQFIVDAYWVQVGGKNPADIIKRLGKRAVAVHFKDFSVNKNNWLVPEICEVGKGNLDWDMIIAAAEEAGTKWAIVEQDTNFMDGDPFKSLKFSYEYLRNKGFY